MWRIASKKSPTAEVLPRRLPSTLRPWQTPLVIINGNLNAHHYLEEAVRPHVLPFVRGQRRNMTFQQDNARPHVARLIMNFLRHENVLVMAWPSMPPTCRQSSTCGTKWTDGSDNDQTSPSRCKDVTKACKKFGKKSHKHSMPTQWHQWVVGVRNVSMREVVTHTTDSVNCCLIPLCCDVIENYIYI